MKEFPKTIEDNTKIKNTLEKALLISLKDRKINFSKCKG